jgi:hypothetical protein
MTCALLLEHTGVGRYDGTVAAMMAFGWRA